MPQHSPYAEPSANTIYNLLFCDAIEDFANLAPHFPAIFDATFDERAVRAIADDTSVESRVRAIAFQRLRREDVRIVGGEVLGVVVEVPLEGGLDTLAAYADGRVRYINQSGKMTIVEDENSPLRDLALALVKVAEPLVREIGPWTDPRLPPPKLPRARLSFIVSDGLYFGDGPMADLVRNPLAAPVINAAVALLQATVDLSTES